ncbi:MAG: ABC transporter permease, partial [Oscillospiraceae bacterium]|nr:ABC transporter permease [Oscillospiraceae bacterium]
MKRNMMQRTTLREIRSTFGRFFAILSIIALGVGFFAGVRITTPSMVHAVNAFLQEKQFYDYRLISTLGWEQADVEAFQAMEDVRYAEGVNSLDVLCTDDEGTEFVLKTQTVPQQINQLMLMEGRMPEQENECIMDAAMSSLHVGDVIRVSSANESDTLDALCYQEFEIVGSAHTSYYLNFERGTTSIGTGSAAGYLYVLPEAYDRDYFTEIFIRFDQDDMIYSQDYK